MDPKFDENIEFGRLDFSMIKIVVKYALRNNLTELDDCPKWLVSMRWYKNKKAVSRQLEYPPSKPGLPFFRIPVDRLMSPIKTWVIQNVISMLVIVCSCLFNVRPVTTIREGLLKAFHRPLGYASEKLALLSFKNKSYEGLRIGRYHPSLGSWSCSLLNTPPWNWP